MFEQVDSSLVNTLVVVLIASITLLTIVAAILLVKTSKLVDESRETNVKVNELMYKVEKDYGDISQSIEGVTQTVNKINGEVLEPIRSIGKIFKIAEGVINGLWNRAQIEPTTDDYLPEPEYD